VRQRTWDPAKDRLNRHRHRGLSLVDGIAALADPLAVSRPDPHPDGDRWQLVGSAAGVVTLFVVYADPVTMADGSEIGRIISVRKATARERKAYEEDHF
jgi:uncharacterized DUF497 family protein